MTVFCVMNRKVCCSKLAILRRHCKVSVVNLWNNLVSSYDLLTVPKWFLASDRCLNCRFSCMQSGSFFSISNSDPQAKGHFFSSTAMVRHLRGSAVLLFSGILTCFVGIQKDDGWLPCPWAHLHRPLCMFNSYTTITIRMWQHFREFICNCTCHLWGVAPHAARQHFKVRYYRDMWWFRVSTSC